MFMRISSPALIAAAIAALFAAAPAFAGLQEGIQAYSDGDKARAVAEWEAGAAEGDATAAYLAAKMYEGGNGVSLVPRRSADYMKMAAEGGHVQAQVELADHYRNGWQEAEIEQNYRAALAWYEEAALSQHAEAQSKLGEMHYAGLGVERNRFEGIRWYQLAAQKYYTPALIHLSGIYWNGDPLPQDKARAYSYLLLARQGATEDTVKGVDRLMAEREKEMTRAQIDAGVRLAEAFRLEHPKR